MVTQDATARCAPPFPRGLMCEQYCENPPTDKEICQQTCVDQFDACTAACGATPTEACTMNCRINRQTCRSDCDSLDTGTDTTTTTVVCAH